MKVEIDINAVCPGCGCVLRRFGDYVACCTVSCKNYGRKFEKPVVVLDEYGSSTSELVSCWATLDETIKLLRTAPRIGADKDEPEGVRNIHISDTLARYIADELEKVRYSEVLALPERKE